MTFLRTSAASNSSSALNVSRHAVEQLPHLWVMRRTCNAFTSIPTRSVDACPEDKPYPEGKDNHVRPNMVGSPILTAGKHNTPPHHPLATETYMTPYSMSRYTIALRGLGQN